MLTRLFSLFPMRREGATQWYNDHMIDFTAENVYGRLAGFSSPLTTGPGDESRTEAAQRRIDIPLVIQDGFARTLPRLQLLRYDGSSATSSSSTASFKPVRRVDEAKVPPRFLNGSNARFLTSFSPRPPARA